MNESMNKRMNERTNYDFFALIHSLQYFFIGHCLDPKNLVIGMFLFLVSILTEYFLNV